MSTKAHIYCLVLLMFLTFIAAPPVFAETNDIVIDVFFCEQGVLIEMQNAGMVIIQESQVGSEQINLILSRVRELQETGETTGYFDPGTSINICGFNNVRPITVLEKN